jgi:hypothetical protein
MSGFRIGLGQLLKGLPVSLDDLLLCLLPRELATGLRCLFLRRLDGHIQFLAAGIGFSGSSYHPPTHDFH